MQANLRTILFVILGALLNSPVFGDEDEENPNLDFLIFLATFEGENGKWQDPMEVDKMLEHNNEAGHDEKNKQEESSDE